MLRGEFQFRHRRRSIAHAILLGELCKLIQFRNPLAISELNRIELLRDVFVWAYQRSSARYSADQPRF